MGTTAFLFVEQDDGSYLHGRISNDGYPLHVGKYLVKFYDQQAAASALVAKGWIPSIDYDPSLVSGDTVGGRYPEHIADLVAVKSYLKKDSACWNYVQHNGVWHTCSPAGRMLPLTRVRLEKMGDRHVRKETAAWFADSNPPPHHMDYINALWAETVRRAQNDPNTQTFGGPGHGFMGVRVTV